MYIGSTVLAGWGLVVCGKRLDVVARFAEQPTEQPLSLSRVVVSHSCARFACAETARMATLEGGQVAGWRVVVREALEELVVHTQLGLNFHHQAFHQLFGDEEHGACQLVIRFTFRPHIVAHNRTKLTAREFQRHGGGHHCALGGEHMLDAIVERCVAVHRAQHPFDVVNNGRDLARENAGHKGMQDACAGVDEVV